MSRAFPAAAPTRRPGPLDELGSAPRIVLLRGGALGDFLVTTPALRALKRRFPGGEITLITSAAVAPLANRYSEISRILVSPACRGLFTGEQDDLALARFLSSMRGERFDLALQWHGGGLYSNPFVAKLGAGTTAGFKTEDASPLEHWIPWDFRQHEVLRYLDLLRMLGIEETNFRIRLPVTRADEDEIEGLAAELDVESVRAGRYIGVHVGSGSPNRRWAPERFAMVADRLLEEFDFRGVVVTAGSGQEEESDRVVQAMARKPQAVNLGGKTSLGALIALISHLRLFIGNDSGPGHMAVGLGTPSVVVFGAANPMNWAPLDRTWHRYVAEWSAPCRVGVCDGRACGTEAACLLGVKSETVLAEARQLMLQMERMELQEGSREQRATASGNR